MDSLLFSFSNGWSAPISLLTFVAVFLMCSTKESFVSRVTSKYFTSVSIFCSIANSGHPSVKI